MRYWWHIVRDSGKLWVECNAFNHAGSLAFYTLFSLAPTVIIAVAVLGLALGEEAAQGQIVTQFQDVMGTEAASVVEEAISNSRIENSGVFPLVAGVVALMVGATTVFAQMQYSLNYLWGVRPKPSRNSILLFIRKRFFSLMVVIAIGFILLVSLVLGVALRASLEFSSRFLPAVDMLINGAELLVSFMVVTLLFATIFKVLPDVVLKWRQVLLGGLVTALLFTLGRYAIAAYLAYTAPASAFGAAGAVVLILMWVYYSSLILMFGAAFTKVHMQAQGAPVHPRNTAVLVESKLLV
ncbi:MAG: YihY/virulence factor BrkB family protein [Pseudohongiella sp.]|nr:YihY/virulence factor BrkB family protein [Pseudohongiella sp.]MDO9520238.1 YihY/virulence factor BrkB family protein [Pseudohongiella sp.]MDP2127043.1 YihY/virulence factor BrkB family protein [Pseudohongiella sp.]